MIRKNRATPSWRWRAGLSTTQDPRGETKRREVSSPSGCKSQLLQNVNGAKVCCFGKQACSCLMIAWQYMFKTDVQSLKNGYQFKYEFWSCCDQAREAQTPSRNRRATQGPTKRWQSLSYSLCAPSNMLSVLILLLYIYIFEFQQKLPMLRNVQRAHTQAS